MKVDVSSLKEKNNILKDKIEDFELSHINVNNCLKNINTYWNSPKAMNFFENVYELKSDIEINLLFFKELSEIYSEIIDKYSKFGNEININLKEKKSIIQEIDEYMEILEKIKKICYEIYNYHANSYQIIKRLDYLILLSSNLKRNINNDFDFIEEKENIIKLKCNSLQIKEIKEFNYTEYI